MYTFFQNMLDQSIMKEYLSYIFSIFHFDKKGLSVRSIEFQNFIDLVTFDQGLVKIEVDIKKMQADQKSLLENLERLHNDFSDVKTLHLQARKAVDEKELYMKVLDDKESDFKKKLALITHPKEYKSLEKELASLNEDRIRHEQMLVTLWNKLEAAEKNYHVKHKLHEEDALSFTDHIASFSTEIDQLQRQLENLNLQRADIQKKVPQEWLDIYVNMKGRVANPVVPVVNDSCDACFYSITPRDLQVLRQSKLLQCRDCYRLLYIQEEAL